MDTCKKNIFCTDKCSDEYLEINSCGIERINRQERGSDRPNGRSDYQLIYVEQGICHLFIDDAWICLGEGSVILFRPGERQKYCYKKEDYSVSHYVHFSGVGCETILKRLGIWNLRVFDMGKSKTFEDISERMTREYVMQKPMFSDWCAAYLYQILNIVARKYALRSGKVTPKSEQRINAASKRIYENIQSPPDVSTLAAECCLSESRFIHLFKEVTGKSITEFISTIRIERAKELLTSTNIPIRDIGESVGYADQNYFSRCFKRIEGCSPMKYRKNEGALYDEKEQFI